MKQIFLPIVSGFFAEFNSPEVQLMDKRVVNASVELYIRVCRELLPIPSKPHYTFNLRDLSKVVQGILQLKPSSMAGPVIVRLWIHECLRTFHDRLVNEEDRLWFTKLLVELLSRHFDQSLEHDVLFKTELPLIFGDFIKFGVMLSERVYEEIMDIKKLRGTLEAYLEQHNMDQGPSHEMNLVFFLEM